MAITQFRKIRRDGKVIDEGMTAKDMMDRGWLPDKVVRIEWDAGGRLKSLDSEFGLLAIVVPGREFLAVVEDLDNSGQNSRLIILNADGSMARQLENIQRIDGADHPGVFSWFEPSQTNSSGDFGVAFQSLMDGAIRRLDIEAGSGEVKGIYPMR